MTRVGVGIATYNRASNLRDTLSGVISTSTPDIIVVADDGSTDDTPDVMSDFPDMTYLRAPNGGIARNKNRLLFRLFAIERCDVVILLEDDTRPILKGWLDEWARAVIAYGSVSVGDEANMTSLVYGGYTAKNTTAQVWAIHSRAWRDMGYMDPRFRGYGFEHAEYQRRAARMGYGGSFDGTDFSFICMPSYPFVVDSNVPSTGTPEKVAAAFETLKLTVGDTGYKPGWDNFSVFVNECLTEDERLGK